MKQVFIAPKGYKMNDNNPFTHNGSYDRSWTILTIDENVQGMLFQQRSSHGCYAVSMTPEYAFFKELFADFIQYETDHGRKIILISKDDMDLDFKTHYKEITLRPSDSRFLIHSTTLSSYEKILSDGLLKSPNRLKREWYSIHPIGLEPLGEPDDYLDHIMFANSGVAPEIVVNSRLCDGVNYDPTAPYTPQVRLYFDGHKMVLDGIVVRNVSSMVFDNVPLKTYLLKAVFAEDLQIPDSDAGWTPFSFAECADDYMKNFL